MRIRTETPVKVLAVFENGKPPMPCKYKIKDRFGEVETVPIHRILSMDMALSFVSYECETYYESRTRKYKLTFWRETFRWELVVE